MRKDWIVKSRTLAGTTDLTLLAPIRKGLVPSLDAMTYKTRARRLLKSLSALRTSSHEYALLRPFSDAVERVGKIHSVRVAIVEPEDKILLAVTFDGAWESYLRVLWQKVGPLLDVIFCNTEGYVIAAESPFEAWAQWVYDVQIETQFFYGKPGLTVDDIAYLRHQEGLHRNAANQGKAVEDATRFAVESAEKIAARVLVNNDGARNQHVDEIARMGLQALVALYRLTDLYLPRSHDGPVLLRAAQSLLTEFIGLVDRNELAIAIGGTNHRFDKQLDWLGIDTLTMHAPMLPPPREIPALPESGAGPEIPKDQIQAGIFKPFEGMTHGCVVLVAFASPTAAAEFLDWAAAHWITWADERDRDKKVKCSIALTAEGFRMLGLNDTQMRYFAEEFVQGMEARAGLLGDSGENHPRRWRLPERFGNPDARVELSAVHAVLQLRVAAPESTAVDLSDRRHPLTPAIRELQKTAGVNVLAVQSLRRYYANGKSGTAVEHFGFADGDSQPAFAPDDALTFARNQALLGELFLGYPSEADNAPARQPSGCPHASERHDILHNGTYLVVRKLRQDVSRLNAIVDQGVQDAELAPSSDSREFLLAKMMGRKRSGEPLSPMAKKGNDFNFDPDPEGEHCPFQAHIRRANPRFPDTDPQDVGNPPGRRKPRIVRRGMSYGPQFSYRDPALGTENTRAKKNNDAERGLFFMAYCASIGEQFDVIQRWISGGNSTGVGSDQGDPFMGVARNRETRTFRFLHDKKVARIRLDGADKSMEDPRPMVRLEWGAYLFVPARKALERLAGIARCAAEKPVVEWSVAEGAATIDALLALEARDKAAGVAAWKTALEDPQAQDDFVGASVWAAIRERHGGVLDTAYGVLVADPAMGLEVLRNRNKLYSVSGYQDRMTRSIGDIYLGQDRPETNNPEADAINKAVRELIPAEAFQYAHDGAEDLLEHLVKEAEVQALSAGSPTWELNFEVREIIEHVLADLCEEWFGIPKKNKILLRGGVHWDWKPGEPPYYPGHFTAPSRYIFQPNPGTEATELGCEYGRAASEAIKTMLDDEEMRKSIDASPIGSVILASFKDPQARARTIAGVMMGFLPTVEGNLKQIFNEWLRDATFWGFRTRYQGKVLTLESASEIQAAMMAAMQLRPVPEVVWRRALDRHVLGSDPRSRVQVEKDDTIVVSLVSATHQALAEGRRDDVCPVFGGAGPSDEENATEHACPGRNAAMAAMTGFFAAFVESSLPLRPSPAPLSFTIKGRMEGHPVPAMGDSETAKIDAMRKQRALKEAKAKLAAGVKPRQRVVGKSGKVTAGAAVKDVIAWGDSWFTRNITLIECIRNTGFRLQDAYVDAATGRLVKEMAQKVDPFILKLATFIRANGDKPPHAIMLSGGGNDATGGRLGAILKGRKDGEGVFQKDEPGILIAGLEQAYVTILGRIRDLCDNKPVNGKPLLAQRIDPIPVLIHGYAYPVPDGRNNKDGPPEQPISALYGPITWFHKYPVRPQGVGIMHELIEGLNKMQIQLVAKKVYPKLRHVDLRPIADDVNQFKSYTDFWRDELHPTEAGSQALALAFRDVLNAL